MSSSNKKTHFKDLSSFSIAAKNTIYEDDEKNDKGNNECPSQFEVENILKENDFGNEEEIGKQYRKYIEEEEYEKDGLLEDLRDPDGSWLVDSELKPLFEWNDDQSNQFKKLLLRLMVEKKQEIKIRDRHKSFVKSLLKKSQSKAFLDLYKKNEVLLSKNIEQTKSDIQMPTYINRAIWFRSDDENLERLIDQAVKEVILLESIWNDTEFINNIYSNDRFDICVEQIFKLKFRFFERFINDRFKRQLQLHALQTEKAELNKDDNDDNDDNESKQENNNNANYVVYYSIAENKQDFELKEEKKQQSKDDEEQDIDDNNYEYHIFPKIMEDKVKADDKKYIGKICDIYVDENENNDFEWSWWKRKTKGDLLRKAKQNGLKSFGFWEILNSAKLKQQNIDKNGVSIEHLNIIYGMLRYYYAKSIRVKALNDRVSKSQQSLAMQLTSTSNDPTLLKIIYCDGEFIPVKFDVDIYIHELNKKEEPTTTTTKDAGDILSGVTSLSTMSSEVLLNQQDDNVSLYGLTWWNGKKRTDCNAIAIKNKTAMLEDKNIDTKDIKEKYYMKFRTADLGDSELGLIDWHWYDNDAAQYQIFKDYRNFYVDGTQHKEHLLHKQLDAIFLSNIDSNYPWKLFDTVDVNVAKNNHSFNCAQITHLKPALEENDLHFNTLGYIARFVRLYASNDAESEFDLNIILSMEQVAITNDGTSFSRNIRRMKNGQNSLSFYYAGSNVFINHWLSNYLLATKAQRLYFWSFILCICTKIKQIDIEIENQLVTIPQYKAFMSAKKADALTFDEGEVRDEQIDAVLYSGFLVPPVLDGESATDQQDGPKTVRGLKQKVNDLSKTRILRKAKVKPQALKNADDCIDDFVWYQSLDGEQYRNSLGVMFRFAEIIRKFILETRHLGEDTSLWPYYRNYFHRNNHSSYHTLINRFNLSLLFNRSDMFELLESEAIVDDNSKLTCFSHFSCKKLKDEVLLKESDKMKSKEVAIRHKRKYAAQLLLQKWSSLRNLNILRHQLGPLLDVIKESADKIIAANADDNNDNNNNNNDDDDKKLDLEDKRDEFMMEKQKKQARLIKIAETYDMKKWRDTIQITNRRLQKNLNDTDSGWQLLTDYDIHRVDSISIQTEEYPFFESFMNHFVLKDINEEIEKMETEMKYTENTWYPLFKKSWLITPDWWSNNHDIVLIELALKWGDNWREYGSTLTGNKASDYMMRLRSSEDNSFGTYIPGHSLHLSKQDVSDMTSSTKDELRPYLELIHWLKQKSNILHRLRYVTNKLVQNLNKIKPSLIEIRIPKQKDQPIFKSQSLMFSQYEREKHKEYAEREKTLANVDNYTTEWTLQAMKTARGTRRGTHRSRTFSNESVKKKRKQRRKQEENARHISADLTNIAKSFAMGSNGSNGQSNNEEYKHADTMKIHHLEPSYRKRQSVAVSRYKADESESDSSNAEFDDEDDIVSDEEKLEIRIHDPFVQRDLIEELREVVHAFDMIKYGQYMANFIINEIREYNMEELWDALAVVLEAMPFPMGLEILNQQMPNLRRSKPELLFKVCKEMVDGTNFGVAAALRMSQYFQKVADSDNFQAETWKEKSVEFEKMAHVLINSIESDHLLYILLTIPLYDTSESMSILSLALEQKRVSFLNNDRILGILRHVWYHSTAIHVEETIETRDLKWSEQFQRLFFMPFRFYMTPVGFNWTIAMLYFLYLAFILLYSYGTVKGYDSYIGDLLFWLFNTGFVMYEISEFSDKGRQYFSVTGIMNVWDILISAIWIILFLLFLQDQVRDLVDIEGDNSVDAITASTTSTTLSPLIINSTSDIYISTTSYISSSTTKLFTTITDNIDTEELDNNLRQLYAFLFAIQLFLLSTRFLTLFQNTKYLGSLLKIVQKMFVEIVKFLCVAAIVIMSFTFGFYFIFGTLIINLEEYNEVDDDVMDFWPTFLFTFDEFIEGGTRGTALNNLVVPVFACFITIFGFLILTNLLIALMTTEYENFQSIADQEVAYMWTETVYDLAHRDRLMPPPLNLIVYVIGIAIHILVWPFAICCPTRRFNLYTWFDHGTYVWLNTFYCGCNKLYRAKIDETKPIKDDLNKIEKKKKRLFQQQARKIYADRFATFLSFSGWIYFRDHIVHRLKRLLCPSCINKCCIYDTKLKKDNKCKYRINKYCRRCCCRDNNEETSSLTAYHKGCYACIKLRVKDTLADQDTTTIKGISMKQYIEIFEDKHRTKLHKEDKILLKHLTVDTLFCDQCFQPYMENDVDQTLMAPFRVLLDYISCFVFLFTAWIPLVLFFALMSLIEYLTSTYEDSISSRTNTERGNEYEEYDREYFPHPLRQIVDR